MANPYLFIVGCPRSGTTLVQRIVDAHPQVAVLREGQWFDKGCLADWFEQGSMVTPDGKITPGLIKRMLDHPKFGRLKISREQFLELAGDETPVDFASFATIIFNLRGQIKQKARVGNKDPAYTLKMDLLHKLWPKARFVHLVRDGRDVCLSVLNWPNKGPIAKRTFASSNDDPVSTVALWWEAYVRPGRESGKSLGPKHYYEMFYEALVARPREECAALCDFLQVPFDEAMLRFYDTRPNSPSAAADAHPWMPLIAGLRDWRTQMAPEDLEKFEAAAGGLLEELGYSRGVPRPGHESLAQATKIRDLLAGDPEWIKRFGSRGARRSDESVDAPPDAYGPEQNVAKVRDG